MAPSAQNVGLLASVGATVRLTPPGLAGFGIQITGTWAGTVQFEGSIDGVTFAALSATPIGGTVSATQATVNGLWQAAAPLVSMQVRMSAWTSGSAVVTLNAVEAATGGAAGGGGGAAGAVSIADAATGSTTDPAVVGDNAGTVNSHLRGLDKIQADVWDSVNHRLHVNVDNAAAIGGGTQYTEDVPAVTDPTGTMLIAVRRDTLSSSEVSADGDNITAKSTSKGELYVKHVDPLTVAQAAAAALNATVVGAGTAGTPAGGIVTVQGVASMTKLLVTPDSVALPANQSVNLAQVGGQTTATAGVNGTLAVGGNVATNVAVSANPVNQGAQGVSAENSAVTTGRMVQLVADLVGKLIVLPYANPENFVSGVTSGQMTATTSTTCVAAPAAGLRNYITTITVSNTHATQATDVLIQDGSNGTTLWVVPAAAAQGGAVVTFPTPLRQPTTATAIFVQNVTTGASTKASIAGYKGA
jgi:hypothetical protein